MIKVNPINSKIFSMTLPNGYVIIYDHNVYVFGVQDSAGNVKESYEIGQRSVVLADTICANFETLKYKYQDA